MRSPCSGSEPRRERSRPPPASDAGAAAPPAAGWPWTPRGVSSTPRDMQPDVDTDPKETAGWLESFDAVIRESGTARARQLLARLIEYGYRHGVTAPFS